MLYVQKWQGSQPLRISDIEHKSKTKNYSRLKSCILLKVTGAGYKGSDSEWVHTYGRTEGYSPQRLLSEADTKIISVHRKHHFSKLLYLYQLFSFRYTQMQCGTFKTGHHWDILNYTVASILREDFTLLLRKLMVMK